MLKPAKGWVLLEEKKNERMKIILTEEAQRKTSEFTITSIDKDSQFKKGDSVIFDNKAVARNDISSIMDGKKEYWICPESSIVATK